MEAKSQNYLTSPTFWFLVAGHLVTLFLAITQSWRLDEVLWVYWFQNVFVGLAELLRFLVAPRYQNVNRESAIGGLYYHSTTRIFFKLFSALFFIVFYGGFHLVYAVLLAYVTGTDITAVGTFVSQNILFPILVFGAGAIVALIRGILLDRKDAPEAQQLLSRPYQRLVAVHLFLVFGLAAQAWGLMSFSQVQLGLLLLFVLVKSSLDILSNMQENV